MNSNWQTYKDLELISESNSISPTQPPRLIERLSYIWRSLISHFQPSQFNELKIHQISDAGGTWWYGYNPKTGQTTFLESERDIDMWREQQLQRTLNS